MKGQDAAELSHKAGDLRPRQIIETEKQPNPNVAIANNSIAQQSTKSLNNADEAKVDLPEGLGEIDDDNDDVAFIIEFVHVL